MMDKSGQYENGIAAVHVNLFANLGIDAWIQSEIFSLFFFMPSGGERPSNAMIRRTVKIG